MENKKHVITRNNVEQKCQKSTQSDVVIPNKLCNDKTCQGLRHWKLLPNLKNNFSKPVRNDIDNNKSRSVLPSRQFNRLDCFAFARNDRGRHPEGTRAEDVRREPYPFNVGVKCPKDLSTYYKNEPSPEFVSSSQLTNKFYPQLPHTDSHVSPRLNGSLCITGREGKKNGNELINLSTYRLIDLKKILRLKPCNDAKEKNVKTLVPQCPSALMPLKKKVAFTLAEVLITLGIIGIVAAMTISALLTKCQEIQYRVTYRKVYSSLNQAIKYAQEDDGIDLSTKPTKVKDPSGNYYDVDDNIGEIFKYISKYYNAKTTCFDNNADKCWECNGESGLGVASSNWVGCRTSSYAFIDANGVSYYLYSNKEYPILIDVNGSRKPNQLGRDRFVFQFGDSLSPNQLYPNSIDAVLPMRDIVSKERWCPQGECYYKTWLSRGK